MYNIIMEQPFAILISHLLFIIITFWALQAFNYEKIIKKNRIVQARLLYAIICIVIGYTLSNFFLDYLSISKHLFTSFK